jgi:hypothetical protein
MSATPLRAFQHQAGHPPIHRCAVEVPVTDRGRAPERRRNLLRRRVIGAEGAEARAASWRRCIFFCAVLPPDRQAPTRSRPPCSCRKVIWTLQPKDSCLRELRQETIRFFDGKGGWQASGCVPAVLVCAPSGAATSLRELSAKASCACEGRTHPGGDRHSRQFNATRACTINTAAHASVDADLGAVLAPARVKHARLV